MNILVLSAGTRNKIIQYFRRAVRRADPEGRVVATDCSALAPAVYEADACYIVPRITEPGYLDRILEIVEKEHITGCLSLIDPELSLIAAAAERFRALGCEPMVSPYDLVETCLHKSRMAALFRDCGLTTADIWMSIEDFEASCRSGRAGYPVFVKPEDGSASLMINLARDRRELEVLTSRGGNMMIQRYMRGQEYGADVYVDMLSGRCVSIFLKKKLKMRAGETDKAVSVIREDLFPVIADFAERAGFRGQIDIDLFEESGRWYFSEVNPRYGGGYPHAYECGVDTPSMYVNNLLGRENEVRIGAYAPGICMMKFNEVLVRPVEGTD